jgi:hypothetical protein
VAASRYLRQEDRLHLLNQISDVRFGSRLRKRKQKLFSLLLHLEVVENLVAIAHKPAGDQLRSASLACRNYC